MTDMQENDNPMPGRKEKLAPGVFVPASLLSFSFVRSSGPGGQNVNKVNTAVVMRVKTADLVEALSLSPQAAARLRRLAGRYLTSKDEIVIKCMGERSQLLNRTTCRERLGEMIVQAKIQPKKRRPTKPSRGSKERRLQAKREAAAKKQRRAWKPED